MPMFRAASAATLDKTGAVAGSILFGITKQNEGLQIHLMEAQLAGEGQIAGSFMILDAGQNRHTKVFTTFLLKSTTASAVAGAIRAVSPGCLDVIDKTFLAVEIQWPSSGQQSSHGPVRS